MCTDFLVAPSQGDPSYCVAARSLEGTPMGSQVFNKEKKKNKKRKLKYNNLKQIFK